MSPRYDLDHEGFPSFLSRFQEALEDIARSRKRVLISMHRLIDGDAIGAGVACGLLLRQRGIEPILAGFPYIPSKLRFLPEQNDLEFHMTWGLDATAISCICQGMAAACNSVFFLDCAESSQIPSEVWDLSQRMSVKVGIDHHLGKSSASERFPDGTLGWVVPATSTCEILFRLVREGGFAWSPEIARALYIGMVSDLRKDDIGRGDPAFPEEAIAVLEAEMAKGGHSLRTLVQELFGLARWERHLLKRCFRERRLSRHIIYGVITREMVEEAKRVNGSQERRMPYHEFYVKLRRRFKRFAQGRQVSLLFDLTQGRATLTSMDREGRVDLLPVFQALGNGGGHRNRGGMDLNAFQRRLQQHSGNGTDLSPEELLEEVIRRVEGTLESTGL